MEQGPWVLDTLWGEFMATGESAPVERIISALQWVGIKGNPNLLLVGGAANWSLISNAEQHQKVMEICEKQFQNEINDSVKERLKEIIKTAKEK